MATMTPVYSESLAAAEDLMGKIGYAAKVADQASDPDFGCRLCDDPVDFFGVITQDAQAWNNSIDGQSPVSVFTRNRSACTVMLIGQAKVVVAEPINRGAKMTVNSDGRFRTAQPGEHVVGRAMQNAARAGDVMTMQILPLAARS